MTQESTALDVHEKKKTTESDQIVLDISSVLASTIEFANHYILLKLQ